MERVPSGNAMRLFPACSEATASRKVSICDLRSLRRSGMCRANCIAQPMSGIRRISILEIYLTCRRPGGGGRWAPLSLWTWWVLEGASLGSRLVVAMARLKAGGRAGRDPTRVRVRLRVAPETRSRRLGLGVGSRRVLLYVAG